MDFLNEITKKFRNNKWTNFILLIAFSWYFLKVNFYPATTEILTASRLTVVLLNQNYPVVGFIFLVVFTIYKLLEKSDRQFRKLEKEHYPNFETWTSSTKSPIETKVTQKVEFIEDKYRTVRQIDIINGLTEKIEYIKGKIEFYNGKIRVSVVEFEEEDIEVSKGVRIHNEVAEKSVDIWNEFHTKIETIKAGGYSRLNINLYGVCFHRTYFLILNKYNYFRIGKFRLPYELSWLKETWYQDIYPRIRWHFRLRSRYSLFGKLPLKDVIPDVFRNVVRITLSLPLILTALWLTIRLSYDSLKLMFHICSIWLKTLCEVIVIIFS